MRLCFFLLEQSKLARAVYESKKATLCPQMWVVCFPDALRSPIVKPTYDQAMEHVDEPCFCVYHTDVDVGPTPVDVKTLLTPLPASSPPPTPLIAHGSSKEYERRINELSHTVLQLQIVGGRLKKENKKLADQNKRLQKQLDRQH